MKFCPECQNTLSLKIRMDDENKQFLEYVCKNCNYKNQLDTKTEKCISKNEYDLQKLYIQSKKNLKYICQDPTIPHINNIPCHNNQCPTHKNESEVVNSEKPTNLVAYTKIEENDMKFMYICCHCFTTWTNN